MKTIENPLVEEQEQQDPDYAVPGPSNTAQQKLFEKSARENASKKIAAIIEKEFSKEIDDKEKEILLIQERLQKALKTLHFLRYVIITDYYNRKQCINIPANESKQIRIHPAVKQLLGKTPKDYDCDLFAKPNFLSTPSTSDLKHTNQHNLITDLKLNNGSNIEDELNNWTRKRKLITNKNENGCLSSNVKKVRICENGNGQKLWSLNSGPPRGSRDRIKKTIFVRNSSKWIPPANREINDNVTHKWSVFVELQNGEDIGKYVSKVTFTLDESYHPSIIEVKTPPFYISRRGYGGFELRVFVEFKNELNPPVNIFHPLKLKKEFTTSENIESETPLDVWIKSGTNNKKNTINCLNKKLKNISNQPLDKLDSISESNSSRSHVFLEHDYIDFERKVPEKENNFTIKHEPIECDKQLTNGVNESSKLNSNQSENSVLKPLKIVIPETIKKDLDLRKPVVLLNRLMPIKLTSNNKTINGNSSTINIKLDPSKCLLLETDYNIPALQIAEPNDKLMKFKTVKKESIKDYHDSNIRLIKYVKLKNAESLVRFIVKRIPLVDKNSDPEFRKIHPYCCTSEDEFFMFHVGKQRALEWCRARTIKLLLSENIYLEEEVWTTKEIMIWCRLHGHTPIKFTSSQIKKKVEAKSNVSLHSITTCTEPIELYQWKDSLSESTREKPIDYQADEDYIEVISTDETEKKQLKNVEDFNYPVKGMGVLSLPKKVLPLFTFISDISRQIGIKLETEEIIPGVRYCASGQILVTTIQCFLEDLLRSSLAKAWERSNDGRCIDVIQLEDVVGAILDRKEFDIFTNAGLGTQYFDED